MTIEIKAPTLPESVPDGTIATWHKNLGDTVKRDELLVDIETDKVVNPDLEITALQKKLDGPLKSIDSAMMENGEFVFKGTAGYPEIHYINITGTKSLIPFFLEPAKIDMEINTRDINKSRIIGSESQTAYDDYLNTLDQYNFKLRENYSLYAKAQELGNIEKAAYYDSLIVDVDNQKTLFVKDFILNNNQFFYSCFVLFLLLVYQ